MTLVVHRRLPELSGDEGHGGRLARERHKVLRFHSSNQARTIIPSDVSTPNLDAWWETVVNLRKFLDRFTPICCAAFTSCSMWIARASASGAPSVPLRMTRLILLCDVAWHNAANRPDAVPLGQHIQGMARMVIFW